MSAETALADDDRWPWLEKIAKEPVSFFVGCSALKKSYRPFLIEQSGEPVFFIHLSGSKELIVRRMNERKGHFMPPQLLESQFAALELPTLSEPAMTVDISDSQEEIMDGIVAALRPHIAK